MTSFVDHVGICTVMRVTCLLWCSLAVCGLRAQEKHPIFLEVEAGAERFSDRGVRAVFPLGFNVELGTAFAMADESRLRLRPQVGAKLFFNEIESGITEQLRMIRLGAQVSYDIYYIGQTTFFPYLSADFNWVANYDAESNGGVGDLENITFSDNYLRGSGFSQEIGMRFQFREWYVKMGYEFFGPRLKARKTLIEGDLASGYITPVSHPFNLNTINVTVGALLGL